MPVFTLFVLLFLMLIPISLFAKWCEKGRVRWTDEDFQLWAFGHKIDNNLPVNQVVLLWSIRNPNRKDFNEADPEKVLDKIIDLYVTEKAIKKESAK